MSAVPKKEKGKPWAKLTLHRIDHHNPALNAALLVALTHAGNVARDLPGGKFPIHVRVEMGGTYVCGEIEPSSIALNPGADSTSLVDPSRCKKWS